jgi:hypothetical protein
MVSLPTSFFNLLEVLHASPVKFLPKVHHNVQRPTVGEAQMPVG